MGTATHLLAYDAARQPLGLMPDHSDLLVQLEHNDTGVLSFSYLKSGVNASFLNRDSLFLAVVENGVTLPYLFTLDDDEEDLADEAGDARMLKVTARGAMTVLEQAVVYPEGHVPGGPVTGLGLYPHHDFANHTAGYIIDALVTRALARGCFPGLTMSFTADADSNGVPWPKVWDVHYAAGTNLLTIVRAACDNGWFDARMTGLTLDLFVPDTVVAIDRPNAIIRTGQQVQSGPRRRSRRGILSHMLGVGAEENTVESINTTSGARYGRREGFFSDGRMTTSGSLRSAAAHQLETQSDAKEGFTLGLLLDPPPGESWPRPLIDFWVGDWIRWDSRRTSPTDLEPLRVRTISFRWGSPSEPRQCEVELNDMFVESTIRLSRVVNGIVNGSTTTAPAPAPAAVILPGSITVDLLPPAQADPTTPGATTRIDVIASLYVDANKFRVSAEVSWPDVTLNTNSSTYIDHNAYQVQAQFDGGAPWVYGTSDPGVLVFIDDLPPGAIAYFRVRAQDTTGNYGAWFTSGPIQLPIDMTPPPQPSAPAITSKLGVVTVAWDGLGSVGEVMPFDFAKLEIHKTVAAGGALSLATLISTMSGQGTHIVTGLTYETTWYFTFVAVDFQGNRSTASTSLPGTAHSLVDADLLNTTLAADVAGFGAGLTAASDAASAADSKATAAGAAALEAAGIANGKGTIYVQSTAPAGDLTGLWINQADGNKPYRYMNVPALTNLSGNPTPVYNSGGDFPEFPNIGTAHADGTPNGTWARWTAVDAVAQSITLNTGTGARHAVTTGDKVATRARVTNPMTKTVYVMLTVNGYNTGTTPATTGWTAPERVALAPGAEVVLEFFGTMTGAAVQLSPTLSFSLDAAGAPLLIGDMVDAKEFAAYIGAGSPSSSPVPYFTGATAGASWNGTVNWSSSTRAAANAWVAVQDQATATAAAAALAAQNAATQAAASANTAQLSADGKTKTTHSASAPTSGSPGTTVGDTWFQHDATEQVIGQWRWTGTAWAQQTIDGVILAHIDAAKITVGTLAAARIGAKTITADKLIISDFTNYAAGSDFEGTTHPWTLTGAATVSIDRAATGTKSLRIGLGGNATLTGNLAVKEGDSLLFLWKWSATTTFDASAGGSIMRISDPIDDSTLAISSMPGPGTTAAFADAITTFVIPQGVPNLKLELKVTNGTAGYLYVDNFEIRRQFGGEVVVDGTITAKQIKAGSLTADRLVAGSITATQLRADAIDGKTITGATVRTAPSGRRIEMRDQAIQAFDEFEVPMMRLWGYGLEVRNPLTNNLEALAPIAFSPPAIDVTPSAKTLPINNWLYVGAVFSDQFTIKCPSGKSLVTVTGTSDPLQGGDGGTASFLVALELLIGGSWTSTPVKAAVSITYPNTVTFVGIGNITIATTTVVARLAYIQSIAHVGAYITNVTVNASPQ